MRPSASNVALALVCGHPFADGISYPDSSGPAAELGTACHAVFEETIREGDVPIVLRDDVRPYVRSWVDGWWAEHRDEQWMPEAAFAVNPANGHGIRLQQEGTRDYSKAPPGYIPGTADAVRIDGDTAYVVDFKTGHNDVAAAQENSQLATLALAIASVYGVSRVVVSIVYVRPHGCREDVAELDTLDLEAFRARLRKLAGPNPNPGDHCRKLYCNGYGLCPATQTAIEVSDRRLPIVAEVAEIQSPEHAAYLYEQAARAEAVVKAVQAAVRQYANQTGGVPLPNGKTYRFTEREEDSMVPLTAEAADHLARVLGEGWRQAVSMETSKAAIKDVARLVAKASGRTIKDVEAEVFGGLRSQGVLRRVKKQSYKEV